MDNNNTPNTKPVDANESLCLVMGQMRSSRPPNVFTSSNPEVRTVYRSETTLILRRENVGMKVLLSKTYCIEKMLSILEHEQRVSNYLPPSCQHRKVHHLDSYEGNFGFKFDWVEGITLGEWLVAPEQQHARGGEDIMTRLHVAMAVAKSVANLHDAGVAHASITPENIILSFEAKSVTATLIDLSKSTILTDEYLSHNKDAHEAHTARLKIEDLKALGLLLYSVLGGKTNLNKSENEADEEIKDEEIEDEIEDEEIDDSARSKRGRKTEVHPVAPNIPLYLISLISSLIAPAINGRGEIKYQYKSAKDVFSDLQKADEEPEIYLKFHQASEMATRALQLPKDSFCGRLSELTMVQQSLDIVMKSGGKPVLMAVSGHAGSGKTALLKQITKPIIEIDGFVIRCNFESTDSPDTVIVSAFNTFFGNLLNSDKQSVKDSIKRNIRETLGPRIE